jgi:hypothetical protein
MAFQFVEGHKIDGKMRNVIRSHVMKGRNVGKVRKQSAQLETQSMSTNKRIAPRLALQTLHSQSVECDERIIHSVPRTPGSTFSSFSFPVEMQPYGFMERLIYHCMDDMSNFSGARFLITASSHGTRRSQCLPHRFLSASRPAGVFVVSVSAFGRSLWAFVSLALVLC